MEVHRVALVSAGACGGGAGNSCPCCPKNAHDRGSGALRLRSAIVCIWNTERGTPPPLRIHFHQIYRSVAIRIAL